MRKVGREKDDLPQNHLNCDWGATGDDRSLDAVHFPPPVNMVTHTIGPPISCTGRTPS